jgi:hypothetical protein
MGQSRPSTQVVQRTLIIGALIGILLGCIVGAGLVGLYIRQNPPVYAGGAYPDELSQGYKNHYLTMVIDSYLVNRQAEAAQIRLQRFDQATKIRTLGEQSAAYVAAGRGVEAQLINNLAVTLKSAENWDENIIKAEVGKLAVAHQGDPARAQAINTFSAQLLEGQIPDLAGQPPAEQPAATPEPAAVTPAAEAAESGGGFSPLVLIFCCLALILAVLIVYFIGKRRFEARKAPPKQQIVWEGEGAPPLKQWTGTYTLGQDNYDEFFTIETDDGDFLGESGMGILESISGSSPKQVLAFDVGLFDKTDITTLSRVVMTPSAYNNETIRAKIEANPQAEAVVAEPGKKFSFETSALRIEARIDEMELGTGEGGQSYFKRLKVSMDLFLKEGADLKRGEMDIPEEFR